MNFLRTLHWTKISLFLTSLILGIVLRSTPIIIISLSLLSLILFEKKLNLHIPKGLSWAFVIFIICSLILGSYYNYYEKFLWWDDMLHTFYGAAFALIGFIIIQFLSSKRGIKNDVFIVCAFSFCFSVAIGAIWEIYEYSYDSLTGGNMQRTDQGNGVSDTMHDIILESSAALALNVFIYLYITTGTENLVAKIWNSFLKENPSNR